MATANDYPFIRVKNADLNRIKHEFDRYGYMGYDSSEVNEIEYEIYSYSEQELIVKFSKNILFPEFIFLIVDFQNQKINSKGCEIFGFYFTKEDYEITKQFNGEIVMLYWDEHINEEDQLDSIKLTTKSDKTFVLETIDFIANEITSSNQFLNKYLQEEHKGELIEAGKIFMEKEDYIQDYLDDLSEEIIR